MDEDNDDQWLYGEDSASEKIPPSEKGDEASLNQLHAIDNISPDLEPPIIKPLEINHFDNADVVPGEEELLVPLNPPIISPPDSTEELPEKSQNENQVNGVAADNIEATDKSEKKLSDGEQEDEDDDNIDVHIGDIRTTPSYNANLHIKRTNLLTLTKVYHYKPYYYQQQQYQQAPKFAADDFDAVGVINGVPAHEFNLDNLEDKPWKKPGADITDYFNYGFNEDTWRAYCERQKRMRVHESGSGLIPMNQTNNVSIIPNISVPPPNMMVPPGTMNNISDVNSGSINVIGGANTRRSTDSFAKENTIQVMTADRREYSKKNFTPDMSVPPPVVPPPFSTLPPGIPPPFPPMNQYGPPPSEYFPPEMDPYYHTYEPAQDPNWGGPNWNPNIDVKNIISLNNSSAAPRTVNGTDSKLPTNADGTLVGVKVKTEPEDRDLNHDRDRDRDRSRDYDRDRDKESRHRDRSHRHRSRSRSHERRSRKHKSRSRSPGYRSHKKKKSKKSERSKSESD